MQNTEFPILKTTYYYLNVFSRLHNALTIISFINNGEENLVNFLHSYPSKHFNRSK